MFHRKPKPKSELEKTLDELFAELRSTTGDTEQYAKTADQVAKLYKLREIDTPRRISPDQALLVAGNLAGILAIVAYEQKHILTSKAANFVMKLR